MTGCLKIKNDTYYAVLNLKEGGKYKQKWISTKLNVKGNKHKVTEFLNDQLARYEENIASEKPHDILFTDYIKQWLEKKKNKVELVTFEGYEIQVKCHILPYFKSKNLKLSEIKPSHIADFYEIKFKSDRSDGIRMLSFIIKQVLDKAVFYELISRNPSTPQKSNE